RVLQQLHPTSSPDQHPDPSDGHDPGPARGQPGHGRRGKGPLGRSMAGGILWEGRSQLPVSKLNLVLTRNVVRKRNYLYGGRPIYYCENETPWPRNKVPVRDRGAEQCSPSRGSATSSN